MAREGINMQPFHLFRSLTSLTAELMWKHILSRKIIPYMLFVMSESKIHAQNKALVYSFYECIYNTNDKIQIQADIIILSTY